MIVDGHAFQRNDVFASMSVYACAMNRTSEEMNVSQCLQSSRRPFDVTLHGTFMKLRPTQSALRSCVLCKALPRQTLLSSSL